MRWLGLVLLVVVGVAAVAPDPRIVAAAAASATPAMRPKPMPILKAQTDPLPPLLPPEKRQQMDQLLDSIEVAINKVADENDDKVTKAKASADAMHHLHGEHHPQTKQAKVLHSMQHDLRRQQIEAVLCGMVVVTKRAYPPGYLHIQRIAEKHKIEHINLAFCETMYGPESGLDISKNPEALAQQLALLRENTAKRIDATAAAPTQKTQPRMQNAQ